MAMGGLNTLLHSPPPAPHTRTHGAIFSLPLCGFTKKVAGGHDFSLPPFGGTFPVLGIGSALLICSLSEKGAERAVGCTQKQKGMPKQLI